MRLRRFLEYFDAVHNLIHLSQYDEHINAVYQIIATQSLHLEL